MTTALDDPLTGRARAIWGGAESHPIATSFAAGAAEFVARLSLRPGASVLDVALRHREPGDPRREGRGSGHGVDIAPDLIEGARREAAAAGVSIGFEVGDTEGRFYRDGHVRLRTDHNRATDGTTLVDSDHLEVRGTVA